jgi:hypothetical protein
LYRVALHDLALVSNSTPIDPCHVFTVGTQLAAIRRSQWCSLLFGAHRQGLLIITQKTMMALVSSSL